MADPIFSDVAVTWLGAVGCAVYLHFLWQQRQGSALAQASLFLFALLAALFGIRGFFWLSERSAGLGRLVFAAATLLPIAVSLFAEQLLRRHHPLALKLASLVVSAFFFAINLAFDLPGNLPLLVVFLACLLSVLAWNGWLLLVQSGSELSRHEAQLARGAALAAVFSLPLVATDFREELGNVPVRLGALGPLILIHVMLHLSPGPRAAVRALARLAAVLAGACVLSLVFGLVTVGMGEGLLGAWLRGLPVAAAWVLLAAILVHSRLLLAEGHSQNFLRWLLHARLDGIEGLLNSLRKLPLTEEHIVLRPGDLAAYDVDKLFTLAGVRREPLSLSEARTWVKGQSAGKLDAAEQLVDLLERHEMTHVLMVSQAPPLLILLNMPQGANLVAGEIRAGVIQRIARRIAREGQHAH